MTKGYRWQDVLGHRLELSAKPTGEGSALWGSALWGSALWGSGWQPPFADITRRCLSIRSSTGAQGLALAPGVGTVEVELLDLDGALSPGGSVDWLLGHHLRLWVTPHDSAEHAAAYAVIDKAAAGGSFAVPVVSVTAYDVRSLIAARVTPGPIAALPQTAAVRLRAVLDAAGFPPPAQQVQDDTSPLLGDDTLALGDLFARTVESAGGLAWADGTGAVITRSRGWVNGPQDATPSLYVYAGAPPTAPDVTVAQTTDLAASEAIETVRNQVIYSNRAEPPVVVMRADQASIGRYGPRRSETTDLACDLAALEALADRDLALHGRPLLMVEGATVTVYDPDTSQAAGLALGEVVVVGRNDPDVSVWELTGIVAGLDLDLTPEQAQVAITVTETGAMLGEAGPSLWGSARWGSSRWGTP